MRLASYLLDDRPKFGLIVDDGAVDLGERLGGRFADLKALLAHDALEEARAYLGASPDRPLSGLRWLPPIPNPGKIICIGVNYHEHRLETGRAEAIHPTVFTRFSDTQVGHQQPLILPRASNRLDFEGELAVVIGRGGRRIPADDAVARVAGFSVYQDASVRDFQYRTSQFIPGKNFPATGGFGPWLVTPDEIGPLGPQRLTTQLNGETMQDARLSDMIFDVPALIASISEWTTLAAGDVIITGTPGGVGSKRTPPVWLKAGDVVEVKIEGVGLLRNPVVAEGRGAQLFSR